MEQQSKFKKPKKQLSGMISASLPLLEELDEKGCLPYAIIGIKVIDNQRIEPVFANLRDDEHVKHCVYLSCKKYVAEYEEKKAEKN